MEKKDKQEVYRVFSEAFSEFRIGVLKGKVIWSSDHSHPAGADWASLKAYYQTRPYKVEIEEVKQE